MDMKYIQNKWNGWGKIERRKLKVGIYKVKLASVYPAEACPEVTVYLVQLHIFLYKTEKTTQWSCITGKRTLEPGTEY